MPATNPDAPYEVVQLQDLDAWLKEKFTWRKSGSDWFYSGQCKRCGHDVEKPFTPNAVLAFQRGERTDPEAAAMRCNCAAEHKGREGGDGCGAWWGLGLTPSDSKS